MILADKIIDLRKKNGWSQEELAEKLNVSRQAVSKWESAQSVPDMNRVLQMSDLFGVSTDYLLKDDLTEDPQHGESLPEDAGEPVRRVTMEEAQEHGINDSIIHVDFMIGADDLCIDGIRPDGAAVAVFRNGTWA